MEQKFNFTINGKATTVEVEPDMLLVDVIRDVLNMTGTKRGCDNGTCGTCTVVMNGKATKSCRTKMSKVEGADIITIEGLTVEGELHPIQKSIAESGAIQCGFCTPGIVMELYGLLENNPEASENDLTNALNKHLCRCTGYLPIKDGALMARQVVQDQKK